MGRVGASVVTGIVVGLVTAVPAGLFVQAATWSQIHGGMSELTLLLLLLAALLLPPACAFAAGRATYRALPHLWTAQQMRGSLRVNCPQCGCGMKPTAVDTTPLPYTVVECPIHGPFHFSSKTELTMGYPRQP